MNVLKLHVFESNLGTMSSLLFRPEMVVGWYHSHPGFGCWLSGVDINTQQVRTTNFHTKLVIFKF